MPLKMLIQSKEQPGAWQIYLWKNVCQCSRSIITRQACNELQFFVSLLMNLYPALRHSSAFRALKKFKEKRHNSKTKQVDRAAQ